MNYIVKVLSNGQKYIFILLALLVLSACSVSSAPSEDKITELATISISKNDTRADIEKLYGGKAIVFKPEAGFAILGFEENPSLSTLTTDPNAAVASPEVSIAGTAAWGGGHNAWGGGLNAWGGGRNAWGGGQNAWGGGYLSLPVLPNQNRAAFIQMRLPQAHALSKNFGYGIKVAVIDTGIDTAHPAFTGSLAPSTEWKDFVDGDTNPQEVSGGNGYGHGTGVAGIILQVAPKATILPIRVLDQNGMGDSDNVILAIDWAIQKGVKVINLSLGTNEPVAALKTMVSYANQMGVFVITSAGNAGSTSMTFPAADAQNAPYSDKLFSVGSVNSSGSRSSFSNYGSALKFTAPGEQIYSAYPVNQMAHMTGTSFAAPIITGSIILALADNLGAANDVQFYMANSTFGVGSTGSIFGTLDVVKFLQKFPGSPRRQALFVVWDPISLGSSDVAIKQQLEGLGYTVTLIEDMVASALSATGKDIVIISDSVGDTYVNSKFRNVAVPVVVMENFVYDDMLMTGTGSTNINDASGQTQLSLTSNTHPMAAGLSGTQSVYTSSNYLAWGVPSTSASKVATLTNNTSRATIFAYDKGISMVGLNAPARRVGFFFSDFSANTTNTTGWKLFDAAVTWALTGN